MWIGDWEAEVRGGQLPSWPWPLGSCSLTSGCLQPLLFDTVSDLGFWVALRKVASNDGRVPLVHFNLVLHV